MLEAGRNVALTILHMNLGTMNNILFTGIVLDMDQMCRYGAEITLFCKVVIALDS